MMLIRIKSLFSCVILFIASSVFAADGTEVDKPTPADQPTIGSWTFSGTVTNESGDRYGYFFQMQRQGSDFHVKTALIDGQTNKLILFYEEKEQIEKASPLNWHVGLSFIRYNPINDSWVFGVKMAQDKGFNFKVDMLKQAADNSDQETIALRPGIRLQAIQTSRLNGHIQTGLSTKEQFVTGNNAWFGKLWFSKEQKSAHDISTTFCRLSNDNGFYSANLKESDATHAAVTGWRDAVGNRKRMSQFLSIKSLAEDQCLLSLGLPKLKLKVTNTLTHEDHTPTSVAGFSKEDPQGFCVVTEHSFVQTPEHLSSLVG